MPQVFDLSNIVYLLGIVMSQLTATLLARYAGRNNRPNRLLAFYFLTLSGGLLIVFLLYTGLMQQYPWYHLFRTGNIVGLLIMPLSYLYFRTVIKQRGLKRIDILHFLPAIIYLVDYSPVLLFPGSEKMAMTIRELAMPDRGQSMQHGWIEPGINWVIIRTAQMTLYWLLQLRLFYTASKIPGSKQLFRRTVHSLHGLC